MQGTGESVGKDLVPVAIDLLCCTILLVIYLAWSESNASVEEETDLDLIIHDLTYSLPGTPIGAGNAGYTPCLVTHLSKFSGPKGLATPN